MNRRSFLSLLGLGAGAAATKKYFFFGGIFRPKPVIQSVTFTPELEPGHYTVECRDGIIYVTCVTVDPSATCTVEWVHA